MGAFLDKPKTEKFTTSGQGNGLQYGLASMQGWRVEMEDAHAAVTDLPGHLSKWSFFAVFDGHAGHKVSNLCASQLLDTIVNTEDFKTLASLAPDAVPPLDVVQNGIKNGFLHLDSQMRENQDDDKSGSTAVCVVISPSEIFFANCGDSRGILVRSDVVEYSTEDHKPVNEKERARIQNAGGSVMIQRVNGSLAVSRSLGDYDYKNTERLGPTEQMVSPEPEVHNIPRDRSKDQFIVLACDGVWDVMTNQDICNFVSYRLRVTENMEQICKDVLDTCFSKGSRDNMSIVLIKLDACPKPDEESIARDKALDEQLTKLVTSAFKEKVPPSHNTLNGCDGSNIQDLIDINHILNVIAQEDIKDLPPGGGLASKRNHIDQVFEKLCEEYNSGGASFSKAGTSDSFSTNTNSDNTNGNNNSSSSPITKDGKFQN